MIKKIIIYPFFIVLNFFIIMLIGLPFFIDLFFFLIFFILFFKNKNLFFIYNILFVVSIFFVNIFILDKTIDVKQSLTGHKKFALENKYKKNVNEVIKNPPGDLIALDTCSNKITDYKVNKDDQKFITDQLGYRNIPNTIMQSNYILVGDSLVMGSRLSHTDILSEQLNSASKFKFSNIAFGGVGPKTYESNMLKLLPILKKKQKFLLFYFEGNDFNFKIKDKDFYWYGIKIPKYKYLYTFFKLPIVFEIFSFFYEIIAFFLYQKNKKQIRKGYFKININK